MTVDRFIPTRKSVSVQEAHESNNFIREYSKVDKVAPQIQGRGDIILDAPGLDKNRRLKLLDWSNDGLLGVALDRGMYLWSSHNLTPCKLFEYEYGSRLTAVEFSHLNSNLVACAIGCGEIEIWDIKKRTCSQHIFSNSPIALTWNENIIAVVSSDGTLQCHDQRKSRPISSHPTLTAINALKCSPDGYYLSISSDKEGAQIWDRRKIETPFRYLTKRSVLTHSWQPNRDHSLVMSMGSAYLTFWNPSTITHEKIKIKEKAFGLEWVGPNKIITLSSQSFSIWDPTTHLEVCYNQPSTNMKLKRCIMSPDESTFLVDGSDETIRMWTMVNAKRVWVPHPHPLESLNIR